MFYITIIYNILVRNYRHLVIVESMTKLPLPAIACHLTLEMRLAALTNPGLKLLSLTTPHQETFSYRDELDTQGRQ